MRAPKLLLALTFVATMAGGGLAQASSCDIDVNGSYNRVSCPTLEVDADELADKVIERLSRKSRQTVDIPPPYGQPVILPPSPVYVPRPVYPAPMFVGPFGRRWH